MSSVNSGSDVQSRTISQTTRAEQPKATTRSKFGCLTCRKRKVKCDEGRPSCGHCQRLSLVCGYSAARSPVTAKSRRQAAAAKVSSTSANGSTPLFTGIGLSSSGRAATSSAAAVEPALPQAHWPPSASTEASRCGTSHDAVVNGIPEPSQSTRHVNAATTNIFENALNGGLGREFWDIDLMEAESIWAQLPIFSNGSCGLDSAAPEDSLLAAGRSSSHIAFPSSQPNWQDQTSTDAFENNVGGAQASLPAPPAYMISDINQLSPGSSISLSEIAPSEVVLLRHFVDFAIPPILIGVEPRWKGARNALLRIAKSSSLVRHAICSFSALSLSNKEKHISDQACTHYYNLAFDELQKAFRQSESPAPQKTKVENEHIMATIFFLSYVELMMSSKPKHTLDFLRRAHAISKASSTSFKSPLGNQLRIWMKLLDAKVVSAGGEGIHLLNDEALKDFDGLLAGISHHVSETEAMDDEILPSAGDARDTEDDIEDILFNSLNHPAYNFYLQVIDFAGRIAHLDKWHRPRGSVTDELEVMTAAEKIVEDLDALWARRPQILDFAGQMNGRLGTYLSAKIAANVESHLRTYVANYYACFVHLQRAVYPYLASTIKTKKAVEQIVALVRLSDSVIQGEEGQGHLSVSMLWPLMMAGCEVEDVETRDWLISVVQGMSKRVGNAGRTARLIRQICDRQERWRQRADARTVMQEIFGTIFAII